MAPKPDPKKVRENIGKPLAVALKEYMPKVVTMYQLEEFLMHIKIGMQSKVN